MQDKNLNQSDRSILKSSPQCMLTNGSGFSFLDSVKDFVKLGTNQIRIFATARSAGESSPPLWIKQSSRSACTRSQSVNIDDLSILDSHPVSAKKEHRSNRYYNCSGSDISNFMVFIFLSPSTFFIHLSIFHDA